MFKITILYGAIRKGRLSIRAARAVEQALKETGRAEVTFIDIKDYNLPVMEERFKDMEHPSAQLQDISANLLRADGLLFITPEYNNSYSGALKNTVDYFTKEWSKKPIGIVTASDGIQGGINASNLLQLLVLAIDGCMPYQCKLCALKDCPERAEPFKEKLTWDLDNIWKDSRHGKEDNHQHL